MKDLAVITSIDNLLFNKKSLLTLVYITSAHQVHEAVRLMHSYNISQLPVIDGENIVGSLHEGSLLKLIKCNCDYYSTKVADIMDPPFPDIDSAKSVDDAYTLFHEGAGAVIVKKNGEPSGIITRIDLINFYLFPEEQINHFEYKI